MHETRQALVFPLCPRCLCGSTEVLRFNYGVALSELGRVEESLAPLNKCLNLDPGYDNAAIAIGVSLATIGRHDEAEVVLKAAPKIQPDNALVRQHEQVGRVVMEIAQFGEAGLEINLNSSPQRHRGTEKVKESMACRFDTNHPTGECMKHRKHLFFLCVLGASVVQLWF